MNIYVGNLPKKTTEDVIRKLFESHGEVTEVKLIKDQFTGNLKGFGFITMPSKADAQKAIQQVNGYELDGQKLIVNEARPRKDSRSGERNQGGGGYQRGRGRSRF